MTGVGMNPAFAQAVGGSSEGMQQQQQQLQGLPGAIPGMPQHMAGVHPYAMQGMAMAQQYSAAGVPMQYYQVAHAAAPSFAQMVPNYQFGTAPQFMHAGEWEDEYDESNGTVLYGNLEVCCDLALLLVLEIRN
jgi:hypothetical protein